MRGKLHRDTVVSVFTLAGEPDEAAYIANAAGVVVGFRCTLSRSTFNVVTFFASCFLSPVSCLRGLPDDTDYQMHEDYIMWHHWRDTAEKLKKKIEVLSEIAIQGLYCGEVPHASY